MNLKDIMRTLPLGVVVITTFWNSEPVGMLVNTFNSVSLEPPLVMFMADVRKGNERPFKESGTFVANFIDNVEIAKIFAYENVKQRFSKVKYLYDPYGPILEDSYGYIKAKIREIYRAGDHDIIVGEVSDIKMSKISSSLVYYNRSFWRIDEVEKKMEKEMIKY
ncbi:MAG: flavin reductase family protein [Sulfolobaceae archaeon]|nr:flavin reductase family protein [Sulfolobaceae archaeon]